MTQKRRSVTVLAVALVLGTALLVLALWGASPSAQEQGSENEKAAKESSGDITTMHVSGLLAEKSIEDLTMESNLIVRGSVDHADPAIQVKAVFGGISNFTDYTIKIHETIQGEPQEEIVVRLQGGLVDNLNVECGDLTELQVGQEYLLFLYRPDCGGGFNTEGNYYYISGGPQGIYSVDGDSPDQLIPFKMDKDSAVPAARLLGEVETYQKNMPDNYSFSLRAETLSNMAGNLETGFFTQEEYDTMLENLDKYATVISQ